MKRVKRIGLLGLVGGAAACGITAWSLGGVPAARSTAEAATRLLQDSMLLCEYAFVHPSDNTLTDPDGNMQPFYAKLRNLERLSSRRSQQGVPVQVNILHFGDSHIQAGFLTDAVMRHLQYHFGNAGRGFIVPHKLCGSNEPRDYLFQGSGRWESARLVGPQPLSLSMGVSGVAVQGLSRGEQLTLRTFSADGLDYRFNRVRVFHDPQAPLFEIPASLSAEIDVSDMSYDFNTELDLLRLTDTLVLTLRPEGEYAKGPLYGVSLENGRSGVLYHALGVNSACYLHWGRIADQVLTQAAALDPDLVIVSLGSNEAAASRFSEEGFYAEIDRFIAPLRRAFPTVSVLLTSPPEAFRAGVPNDNFALVNKTIGRYAADHHLAFFDLFNATGGCGSARSWYQNQLMGRDRIHYTPKGYQIQGLLLYNALYNGYLRYGMVQ